MGFAFFRSRLIFILWVEKAHLLAIRRAVGSGSEAAPPTTQSQKDDLFHLFFRVCVLLFATIVRGLTWRDC